MNHSKFTGEKVRDSCW